MVKYVEGFRPEFEIFAFGNGEMFKQRHVEVGAPGIA